MTWLTGLLSGEDHCEWPLWVRSRFDLPKEPISDRLRDILDSHAELVRTRVAELERQGFNVRMEDENSLSYRGVSGTLFSGKPDIAIIERDKMTYEDCKTGKAKPSHDAQVLLYAQLARQNRVTKQIAGNVVYPNEVKSVDMGQAPEIQSNFIALMQRVNAGDVPRVPSPRECRYCKVRNYCDERIEGESEEIAPFFDDFRP